MRHLTAVGLAALLLLFSAGLGRGQVIADFESGTNDFYDNGWGTGFTSVSQVADPTGMSAGVLALAFDGSKGKKGDIQRDNVDAAGAQIITYFVYLPADIPDSVVIKLWAQDNSNWAWTEVKYYA
ncbi:MAG TPA: hypothetical protein ENJ23_03265, partial [Bacteroidetes bacterium]|nr:hypothetical protein [Bacteroidota bacterium]